MLISELYRCWWEYFSLWTQPSSTHRHAINIDRLISLLFTPQKCRTLLLKHRWESVWVRVQAARDEISLVLSGLLRAEWAREVTSGKKTGGMRDDREMGRQEQREGNHTHVTDWVSIGPLYELAGACHLSRWVRVWMVSEHCNGGDISVSWGPERFQLLVMTNSYRVMDQRLASSPRHMEKRSRLELKR